MEIVANWGKNQICEKAKILPRKMTRPWGGERRLLFIRPLKTGTKYISKLLPVVCHDFPSGSKGVVRGWIPDCTDAQRL